MEQVITYKDEQMGFLQDVEGLKQEKASLVSEKVHPDIIPRAQHSLKHKRPCCAGESHE